MLALVGIGITVAVYGVVALIVKADDAGRALARNEQVSAIGGLIRALGRALVLGMPVFLTFLSAAGTAAMIWVGRSTPYPTASSTMGTNSIAVTVPQRTAP